MGREQPELCSVGLRSLSVLRWGSLSWAGRDEMMVMAAAEAPIWQMELVSRAVLMIGVHSG